MPLNMFRPKASQTFATHPPPPTHTGGPRQVRKLRPRGEEWPALTALAPAPASGPSSVGSHGPSVLERGRGGGLLEGKEVRWGHPGPRRTANTCALLRAVEGLPLSFPTDSQRSQLGWRKVEWGPGRQAGAEKAGV